jgi:hypothetical protein
MNEEQALRIVGALMTDLEQREIILPAAYALILQSALMLAAQNVREPAHQQMHRTVAERLQAALQTVYPYDFSRPMSLSVLRAASAYERDLTLIVTYRDIYNMVCALQLMIRYPEAGASANVIFHIGFRLQSALTERHAGASALLNMGWDTRYDRA